MQNIAQETLNFSFINRLSLLTKAVSDNDEPVPGYMYKEITNISFESGSSCQDLLTFLSDHLTSKSCFVRMKVLKILLYVVKNGHSEFRDNLRKKSLSITESIQFSGPPDPHHGMTHYHQVRKLAAELSETLFTIEEHKEIEKTLPASNKYSMGGMGNSGGKIKGFGNSPVKPKSYNEELISSIKQFTEKLTGPKQSLEGFLESREDSKFGVYEPVKFDTTALQPESSSPSIALSMSVSEKHNDVQYESTVTPLMTESIRSRTAVRLHGVPGGGWADNNIQDQLNSQTNDIQQVPQSEDIILSTNESSPRCEESDRETHVIEELILHSTDTYLISHATLKTFVKRCSTLNGDLILQEIDLYLQQSQTDIVQMRAMLVLEAVIHFSHIPISQVINQCSPCLVALCNAQCNDHNEKTKLKARKILRILEVLSKRLLLCE